LPSYVPIDYAKKYENTPIWQSCIDDLKNKPYALRNLKRSWEIENLTDGDISRSIGLYLAEVELMDYNIGRLLDEIEALGLSNNTAIIYTTDHGDMCGSHRLVDKHFNMYDDITRVPLIIKYQKMFKSGSVSEDYVCNAIDLASTICDIAEVATPETFEGISLKNEGKTGRKDIISAYYGGPSGLYTQRMLRNDDFKYVYNATDIDELYDMKNDPWELHNLVYDGNFNLILGEMRKRLIEVLRDIKDPIAFSPWIVKPLIKNIKL
jgi:arylsulfatase A-like enzyme